jgi:hypothetical protein
MMIDEFQERRKPASMHEDKEIKVRIPLDYHIKLHTVKVVSGTAISDTVKEALENYFDELAKDGAVHTAATTQ